MVSRVDPYKIILADDHAIMRAGIKMVIESKTDLRVVGEAANGAELLGLLGRQKSDMVILDLGMPEVDGLKALSEIRTHYPKVKVIVLTMHKQRAFLKKALSKGAFGYVLKEDAYVKLLAAIHDGRRGKRFISDGMMSCLIDDYARDTSSHVNTELLTRREREILHLLANGLNSREIGDRLDISPRTVETHRANIREKLGLANTAELIKYAIDNDLD